ncbi:MAG: ABC transporter substrate-binding protein [Actinomycetota bacterium]
MLPHSGSRRRAARTLALAVVACLLAAGCGSDAPEDDATSGSTTVTDPTTPTTTAPPTTTVAEAEAETETEAEADARPTIVALDETVAVAMLSLGIEPDHVLTTLSSETFAVLNKQLAIPTTDFVIAEPSFELLAGLRPELIVGIASPFVTQSIDEYERLAPTVVVPIDLSWQEQLRSLAADLDAGTRAEQVIRAIDELQGATTDALADAGATGRSVSLLTVRVGNVLAADGTGSSGSLLTAVGLDRPATQREPGPNGVPFLFLSNEAVAEQNADVLLLAEATVFDLEPLLDSPVYAELPVVQAGAVHRVVGDAWMVGGTGFAAFWLLQDLEAIFVDDDPVGTLADTPARWRAFLELVG